MKLQLKANAKINLFLDILGRLPNGYHSLFMIMQSVSLADIVTVCENADGVIRLTCSEAALPTDGKNIAYRAECTTGFPHAQSDANHLGNSS